MHSAPRTVTFYTAPRELEALGRALASGGWALDLAGCSEFDSSLIAVMLELERRAKAAGARCRFHRPAPNLVELARLYGVHELLFVDRD
ncbi:MAG: STAS domain-containing protein [Burkholderiaceae bacterium]|nr:STAS domain-containing protein [Burkholderiaceae bacterium]